MLNRRSLLSKGLGLSAVAGLAVGAGVAVSEEPKVEQNFRSLFHDPFYYNNFLRWVEVGKDSKRVLFSWPHTFDTQVYTPSKETVAPYYKITESSEQALRERIEVDCKAMVEAHTKNSRGRNTSFDLFVLIEKCFIFKQHGCEVTIALAILPYEAPISDISSHFQPINISTNLGRERVFELGRRKPYFRYVKLPPEIPTV